MIGHRSWPYGSVSFTAAMLCILACSIGAKPARPRCRTVPAEAAKPAKGDCSDEQRLWRQMLADERRFTIRQVNLFYYHFVHRCVMEGLPDDVLCQYIGLLGTEIGWRRGQRVMDSIGLPLSWSVYKDGGVVIFEVGITTKPTPKTVAKCCIEGQEMYLNVLHVNKDRDVDEKLPELGGRSVREVLSKMDKLTVGKPAAR